MDTFEVAIGIRRDREPEMETSGHVLNDQVSALLPGFFIRGKVGFLVLFKRNSFAPVLGLEWTYTKPRPVAGGLSTIRTTVIVTIGFVITIRTAVVVTVRIRTLIVAGGL